jgi:hypothetical protein
MGTRSWRTAVATVAAMATAPVLSVVALPAAASAPKAAATAGCQLDAGPIKHMIYLQFDNVHFRSDAAGVPGDLEQMPHLLNFLKGQGTLFTNDHTILISHTAGGILSSLTGLYPDRNGSTVTNAYGYFQPGNNNSVGFSSDFKYWTDQVDAVNDAKPNMITNGGLTTPAPWVPFTRAGCDVGGAGVANLELENTATNATGDMSRVFGAGSPEWNEASAAAALPSTPANAKAKGEPQTDFVGIAVHCAKTSSSRCADNPNAHPDPLSDEPGGYIGYQALYGAKYVDPAIAGGNPCVNDTAGRPITDPAGTCGFPGFDGMLASNTLGYVAQMQESGVPVTFGYLSDVHDAHTPNPNTDSYQSSATGPGEAAHEAQLKSYDDAFARFFADLAAHGINQQNTLFAVTVDEGDHFTGGAGVQAADGTLTYASDANGVHTACAVLTACPANQIGEVNANVAGLLPPGEPAFSIHNDDAPTFYLNGKPASTDPKVRQLERDVAALRAPDPYNGHAGGLTSMTVNLADPVEEKALHMVNADPNRTSTFTLFGNDDYFFTTSDPNYTVAGVNQCAGTHLCAVPSFAWNHGDVQDEIGNTWVGFVGPGIARHGIDTATWTDHTNVRPTILSLLGLKDDYAHDGRVLVEGLQRTATPPALRSGPTTALAQEYEQLNAPFGDFADDTLTASTKALSSGTASNDATYTSIESQLSRLTAQRDGLAGKISAQLDAAAFSGRPVPAGAALAEIVEGKVLTTRAHQLAAGH